MVKVRQGCQIEIDELFMCFDAEQRTKGKSFPKYLLASAIEKILISGLY